MLHLCSRSVRMSRCLSLRAKAFRVWMIVWMYSHSRLDFRIIRAVSREMDPPFCTFLHPVVRTGCPVEMGSRSACGGIWLRPDVSFSRPFYHHPNIRIFVYMHGKYSILFMWSNFLCCTCLVGGVRIKNHMCIYKYLAVKSKLTAAWLL